MILRSHWCHAVRCNCRHSSCHPIHLILTKMKRGNHRRGKEWRKRQWRTEREKWRERARKERRVPEQNKEVMEDKDGKREKE